MILEYIYIYIYIYSGWAKCRYTVIILYTVYLLLAHLVYNNIVRFVGVVLCIYERGVTRNEKEC